MGISWYRDSEERKSAVGASNGSWNRVGCIGAEYVGSLGSEDTAVLVVAISAPTVEGSRFLETCCITAELGWGLLVDAMDSRLGVFAVATAS